MMNIDNASRWYNIFSKVYDNTNDYPYKPVREKAIQALNIKPGDTVLDLFCGTGVNFAQILAQLQGTGNLIAIDGSSGMLQRAQSRIQENRWDASRILLLQQDLQKMKSNSYAELLPKEGSVKVLMTLGAGGLPGWEQFWDDLCNALPKNSRIVSMDAHCPKGTLSGAVINFFGTGNFRKDVTSFRPWERLKARSIDYNEEAYHPFSILNCSVVVSTGIVE